MFPFCCWGRCSYQYENVMLPWKSNNGFTLPMARLIFFRRPGRVITTVAPKTNYIFKKINYLLDFLFFLNILKLLNTENLFFFSIQSTHFPAPWTLLPEAAEKLPTPNPNHHHHHLRHCAM